MKKAVYIICCPTRFSMSRFLTVLPLCILLREAFAYGKIWPSYRKSCLFCFRPIRAGWFTRCISQKSNAIRSLWSTARKSLWANPGTTKCINSWPGKKNNHSRVIPSCAGPFNHFPSPSNREPWQGQSQECSSGFHDNAQPRCGHTGFT